MWTSPPPQHRAFTWQGGGSIHCVHSVVWKAVPICRLHAQDLVSGRDRPGSTYKRWCYSCSSISPRENRSDKSCEGMVSVVVGLWLRCVQRARESSTELVSAPLID